MSRLPLQNILQTSLNACVIVCDNARSHSSQIAIVSCHRRQLAQERRDERRWLSTPGDTPKSRSADINHDEEDNVAKETVVAKESNPPSARPPTDTAQPHFSAGQACASSQYQTFTNRKATVYTQVRATENAREIRQQSSSETQSSGKPRVCLQSRGRCCFTIEKDIAQGLLPRPQHDPRRWHRGSGPLRIPVRQRSIKGIDCSSLGKDFDAVPGNKEVQLQSKENKLCKSKCLGASDSACPQEHSRSPLFKRKTFNSTRYVLLETASREVSILPTQ